MQDTLNKRELGYAQRRLEEGKSYSFLAERWGMDYSAARMRCLRNGLRSINGPGAPKGNKNWLGRAKEARRT